MNSFEINVPVSPDSNSKVNPEAVTVTDTTRIVAAARRGPSAAAIVVDSLLRKGQLKEAESVILAVLQQPGKTWEHYIVLAQVYSAQKRTHEAREAYQHAVLVAPLQARPHFRFGEFLFRKGALREAEDELRAAIRISPNISDFHTSLGAVLLEQGWVKEAHPVLRRAIRLDRKSARAREVLGKLLARKGRYGAAERSLTKAHALDPDSRSALAYLAKLLEEQGKTDKAIACSKKILALDPSDAESHVRISRQYQRTGRLDEAEQAIRAALALQPSAEYCNRLSHILGAQSRACEAVAAMSEACRLDPESQVFRSRLADLAATNGASETPGKEGAGPAIQRNLAASPRGLIEKIRFFWAREKR